MHISFAQLRLTIIILKNVEHANIHVFPAFVIKKKMLQRNTRRNKFGHKLPTHLAAAETLLSRRGLSLDFHIKCGLHSYLPGRVPNSQRSRLIRSLLAPRCASVWVSIGMCVCLLFTFCAVIRFNFISTRSQASANNHFSDKKKKKEFITQFRRP